jgi:hypothetical protein
MSWVPLAVSGRIWALGGRPGPLFLPATLVLCFGVAVFWVLELGGWVSDTFSTSFSGSWVYWVLGI